jgi:hypothetical protein
VKNEGLVGRDVLGAGGELVGKASTETLRRKIQSTDWGASGNVHVTYVVTRGDVLQRRGFTAGAAGGPNNVTTAAVAINQRFAACWVIWCDNDCICSASEAACSFIAVAGDLL